MFLWSQTVQVRFRYTSCECLCVFLAPFLACVLIPPDESKPRHALLDAMLIDVKVGKVERVLVRHGIDWSLCLELRGVASCRVSMRTVHSQHARTRTHHERTCHRTAAPKVCIDHPPGMLIDQRAPIPTGLRQATTKRLDGQVVEELVLNLEWEGVYEVKVWWCW